MISSKMSCLSTSEHTWGRRKEEDEMVFEILRENVRESRRECVCVYQRLIEKGRKRTMTDRQTDRETD